MLLFLLSLILLFQKLSKKTQPQRWQIHFGHFIGFCFFFFFKKPQVEHSCTSFVNHLLLYHCVDIHIYTDTQILMIKKLNINETKQTSQANYVDFSRGTRLHTPTEGKARTDGFLALISYCSHTYTTSYFGLIFLSKLTVINNKETDGGLYFTL